MIIDITFKCWNLIEKQEVGRDFHKQEVRGKKLLAYNLRLHLSVSNEK